MKHILPILTAALLGVAAPVFAETFYFDGFSVETTPYTNANGEGEGEGSYYTITKKGSGSLFITNFFHEGLNDGLSGQDEILTNPSYGITHYGYIDSNGKSREYTLGDARITDQFEGYSYSGWVEDPNHPNGGAMGTTVVPRDGYFLGNFADGAEIQVYLERKDANGNVIAWTASNTPQESNGVAYVSRWGGRVDAANNSMAVGQLFFPKQGEPEMNFGIIASTTRDIPGITDVAGGPVGSPLPGGVQIALIAGLFGLGFWYIRRRKSVVA